MNGWWWNTRLNVAIDSVGNAHRDTLLLWYALMRELGAEAGTYGEFSTSVEHWARRYGAEVPSKAGDYYASWRSIQEQFWAALEAAGVIEVHGDMTTGARVRVRVVDMVEQGRPVEPVAIVQPVGRQVVSAVRKANTPGSLSAARSKHRRAFLEGAECSAPDECKVCDGEWDPVRVIASLSRLINGDSSRLTAIADSAPADIHASAPTHTSAPDYSPLRGSSPNGVTTTTNDPQAHTPLNAVRGSSSSLQESEHHVRPDTPLTNVTAAQQRIADLLADMFVEPNDAVTMAHQIAAVKRRQPVGSPPKVYDIDVWERAVRVLVRQVTTEGKRIEKDPMGLLVTMVPSYELEGSDRPLQIRNLAPVTQRPEETPEQIMARFEREADERAGVAS